MQATAENRTTSQGAARPYLVVVGGNSLNLPCSTQQLGEFCTRKHVYLRRCRAWLRIAAPKSASRGCGLRFPHPFVGVGPGGRAAACLQGVSHVIQRDAEEGIPTGFHRVSRDCPGLPGTGR